MKASISVKDNVRELWISYGSSEEDIHRAYHDPEQSAEPNQIAEFSFHRIRHQALDLGGEDCGELVLAAGNDARRERPRFTIIIP
jgi:hypothetical protein